MCFIKEVGFNVMFFSDKSRILKEKIYIYYWYGCKEKVFLYIVDGYLNFFNRFR